MAILITRRLPHFFESSARLLVPKIQAKNSFGLRIRLYVFFFINFSFWHWHTDAHFSEQFLLWVSCSFPFSNAFVRGEEGENSRETLDATAFCIATFAHTYTWAVESRILRLYCDLFDSIQVERPILPRKKTKKNCCCCCLHYCLCSLT